MLENTNLLIDELNKRIDKSESKISEVRSVINNRENEKEKRTGIYGSNTENENRELDEEISAKNVELQNAENEKKQYNEEINKIKNFVSEYQANDELISKLTQSNVNLNKELQNLKIEESNNNLDYIKQELTNDIKKIKDEIERNNKEIEALQKKQQDTENFINDKISSYGLNKTEKDDNNKKGEPTMGALNASAPVADTKKNNIKIVYDGKNNIYTYIGQKDGESFSGKIEASRNLFRTRKNKKHLKNWLKEEGFNELFSGATAKAYKKCDLHVVSIIYNTLGKKACREYLLQLSQGSKAKTENAPFDITYNLSELNLARKLDLFDKIRISRMTKNHKNMANVIPKLSKKELATRDTKLLNPAKGEYKIEDLKKSEERTQFVEGLKTYEVQEPSKLEKTENADQESKPKKIEMPGLDSKPKKLEMPSIENDKDER